MSFEVSFMCEMFTAFNQPLSHYRVQSKFYLNSMMKPTHKIYSINHFNWVPAFSLTMLTVNLRTAKCKRKEKKEEARIDDGDSQIDNLCVWLNCSSCRSELISVMKYFNLITARADFWLSAVHLLHMVWVEIKRPMAQKFWRFRRASERIPSSCSLKFMRCALTLF